MRWLAHFEGVGNRRRLASVVGTVWDITERKAAEERLRESEERLRFIADRAHVGYWHWQIAADRLEWSPLVNQLFGIPSEDPMSYARFLDALHPDDRERTDRAVRACLESSGQEDYDIEYRTLWPDETVRWIHAKVAELERDGHVSLEAKRLLARFEEILELHIADRDRLETELAEISK